MAKKSNAKIQLVDDWQQSWKFLSVQLTTILVVLQVLEENMPAVQQYLPEGWVKYVGLAILIGRLVRQKSVTPVESSDSDQKDPS